MIKIAAVPYLNALPLYEGLNEFLPQAQLSLQAPVQIANALKTKRADVGLVPLIALLDPGMEDLIALPDLGICSKGEVLSVYVGSQGPFAQAEEIYLDPESRTSNALLRVLMPEILNQEIRYLSTVAGYEREIKAKRAGLIIGDRALSLREDIPYKLDLGKTWFELTSLPFTFALWAIRRDRCTPELVEGLHRAASLGEMRLEEIASKWSEENPQKNIPALLAQKYLTEHIYYRLDKQEHEGIKQFLHFSIAHNILKPQKEIAFYETSSHHRSGTLGKRTLGH